MGEVMRTCASDLLKEQGFVVLPGFASGDELAALRADCDGFVASSRLESHRGCLFEPLTCLGLSPSGPEALKVRESKEEYVRARSVSSTPGASAVVAELLTGNKIAGLVRELLGGTEAYVYNEQYIVKGPGSPALFDWHRDGDYHPSGAARCGPYLALWLPLDDVNDENGTAVVAPHPLPEGFIQLPLDDQLEASRPLTVEAGTLVVWTEDLLHMSGPNLSEAPRRVYMPQLGIRPNSDPTFGLSVPCGGPAV